MGVRSFCLWSSLLVLSCLQFGCSGWSGDFGPITQIAVSSPGLADKLAARGGYLAKNVAACGTCHGLRRIDPKTGDARFAGIDSPLAGGLVIKDRAGEVVVPNITPESKTGIGRWSIAEVMRAVRASIDRDGQPLSIDSHRSYRWMSDEDAKSIAVYLLQQKPIKAEWPRRILGAFERNRIGLIPVYSDIEGYVPAMTRSENAGYGRYLANSVAQCSLCHGDNNIESRTPGVSFAGGGEVPKLTQAALEKYLSSGKSSPSKGRGASCPVDFYRGMSSEDMRAIVLYLTKMQS